MTDFEKQPVVTTSGAQSPGHRATVRSRPWWRLGGTDVSFVSVDDDLSVSSASNSIADSESANDIGKDRTVFASEDTAEIYAPPPQYEGFHRFDSKATWTPEEETALVRKLDYKICLWACVMFVALQLDRANISQAISANELTQLKLTTNDYNNGMTIFYCSFLFAELPSQLVSKKIGPDNWIPIQMIAWSIVASSQAALTGKTSFYITRCLLGLIEGGFIPDTVLYLSYFYKNSELPRRLSYFWTAYQFTNVLASIFAYGILHLNGVSGLAGWRWLYALEGSFTALIGIATIFLLPPSPTQTRSTSWKGFLRGKNGWFTEREETIMVTRVLRDDPGKATMHNRQGLDWPALKASFLDYDMWPIYLIGFTWTIPATPPSAYLTLNLKALGFTTFQTNLLVIPSAVLFMIQLLTWTWISEKINQRLLIGVIAQLWMLPLLITLEVLPKTFAHANWVRWAVASLLVGYPYVHAILVALTSRNSGTVRTRTVASSMYNIAVQASSIFSSQIYRADDKPLYKRGNKILLGIAAYNILLFIASKTYYVYRNKQRDEIWASMTREERVHYLRTTKDEGNKRLDFRFAH